MIKAKHKWWAGAVFHPYIIRLIRKQFHNLYLMKDYPRLNSNIPILLMPNHSTWWDGFFVYLLNHYCFRRPLYLMMLEEQLSKYSFFSKVGAYSIDPGRPKSVLETMKYTLDILQKPLSPAPLVCFFPQGEMQPLSVNKIKFKKGYEWLQKGLQKEFSALLLGMRVEFLEQQQPEVFFQFETLDTQKSKTSESLERTLEQILAEMLKNVIHGRKGNLVLKGRRSVNEIWDNLRLKTKTNQE